MAHVIHSLGAGGAEGVLTEMVAPARDAGVDVVVMGLSDAQDDRAAVALRETGASVHEFHAPRYDPRVIRTLQHALVRERIDVVHTHLKHADVVGGLAARRLGLPAVSTLHVIEDAPTGPAHRGRVRLAALARKQLFRRVIVLSAAQREWYELLSPGSPVRLIPNGIRPPSVFSDPRAVRAGLGVSQDELLAVTVSLMRPEKGHGDLLEAVRRMKAQNVVVALAGDGPLLDHIRAQVNADPALAHRVRVLGFRHDVDDLLAAADLVVHPSRADALPTALISALAAGRPIVATRVGGIPDIATSECGVLVPPADADALAAALDNMAREPQQRAQMGLAGRQRFAEGYSAEVWVARLRELYLDILNQPCSSRSQP